MIMGAWSPAAWAAIGACGTLIVYIVIAVYAVFQVREARRLREEQARPWVVVDFEPGWILWLTIENIGKTVATDVRMRFDPPLASTQSRPWEWEESSTFTEGIPLLPPGKKLRFFVDGITARLNDKDLPRQHDVSVDYHGPVKRKRPLNSTYILDINHYWGSSPPPKGIPELVDEVEKIHKELNKWTDGISGLRVNVTDREKEKRQSYRPFRLKEAQQIVREDGAIALGRHILRRALQRRGWWLRN